MPTLSNFVNQSNAPEVPRTALDSINDQLDTLDESLRGLRDRIGGIAYKLDGPGPNPKQPDEKQAAPMPVGSISEIRARTRACLEIAVDLHIFAERLEQLI